MAKDAVKRAAGFVIYRQKGDIEWLLMQTSYGQHHWTPPKGHLDPGEDDMTAALRETKEEAGLDKEQLTVFQDVKAELRYQAFGKPKIVTYWLAKLNNPDDKVILSEEHQDFKWLQVEEACKVAGFKEMAQVLRDFQGKVESM